MRTRLGVTRHMISPSRVAKSEIESFCNQYSRPRDPATSQDGYIETWKVTVRLKIVSMARP
jgi:hypothetical protein